jgi:hypothetical protein
VIVVPSRGPSPPSTNSGRPKELEAVRLAASDDDEEGANALDLASRHAIAAAKHGSVDATMIGDLRLCLREEK